MRPKIAKIVCGIDAGEHAEPVLAAALDLAVHYGAELLVANALESIRSFQHARMAEYVSQAQLDTLQAEGRARIEDALRGQLDAISEADEREALQRTRIVFVEGRPSSALLELANTEGAGMIVVGSHSHGALGEMLLGSTAHEICHRAQVPVMLVPVGR